MANLISAREAEKEFGAEIVEIKKSSPEYAGLPDQPACPAVAVNGKLIAQNDVVTFEQIKTAILRSL